MIDPEMLALAKKLPIFKSLTQMELRKIAEMENHFRTITPGETFITENTKGDSFFIILEGTAIVTKNAVPGKVLGRIPPGSVCGELAYLTGGMRITNVMAQQQAVKVMEINKAFFRTVGLEARDKIKDNLMGVLVGRINSMNQDVTRLTADVGKMQKEIVRMRKEIVRLSQGESSS